MRYQMMLKLLRIVKMPMTPKKRVKFEPKQPE